MSKVLTNYKKFKKVQILLAFCLALVYTEKELRKKTTRTVESIKIY